MKSMTVNGQRLAYRHKHGGGPCIVFANSLGSAQSLWDDVIELLPGGFDTLTYDLRGHGLSGLSGGFTVPDLADDLIGLLDALEIKHAILCGVSVGGMIAMAVAAKRPDLVSAAILSNTAPKIGTEARWTARIEAVRAHGIEGISDQILDNWFAPGFKEAQRAAWHMYRDMLLRTPKDAYIATCAALRDSDLTPEAARIDRPVLCIAGDQDGSVPPDAVIDMARLIPGASHLTLAGVGHLPAIEAPAQVANAIERMATQIQPRFDQGMAIRRHVLGDAHVDRAEAEKTNLDLPFQTLITESAWGTVWASPGISHRERSMLTLALLAALGNFDEIPMHVRATARTGATIRDIQEAFQHVAIYAGVPRANHALKLARQILASQKDEKDG